MRSQHQFCSHSPEEPQTQRLFLLDPLFNAPASHVVLLTVPLNHIQPHPSESAITVQCSALDVSDSIYPHIRDDELRARQQQRGGPSHRHQGLSVTKQQPRSRNVEQILQPVKLCLHTVTLLWIRGVPLSVSHIISAPPHTHTHSHTHSHTLFKMDVSCRQGGRRAFTACVVLCVVLKRNRLSLTEPSDVQLF